MPSQPSQIPNPNPLRSAEIRAYWGFGFLRRWLFRHDPEIAHALVVGWLKRLFAFPLAVRFLHLWYGRFQKPLHQTLFGVRFASPVGLAAGFDKDGELASGMHGLGFGFIEVGTVTLKPQEGNPKPRLWRRPDEGALENAMGFNNHGVEALVQRLRAIKNHQVPIGVNIGRNRHTPNEEAPAELLQVLEATFPYADFFVVNVSTPNTPGLREMQDREQLEPLLSALCDHAKRLAILHGVMQRPMLVKIAPELSEAQLLDVAMVVRKVGLQGVIASNSVKTERGGMTGKPLLAEVLKKVGELRHQLGPEAIVIGVGGIFSPKDALAVLRAGANLMQIYTGYIYRGPALVPAIHRRLKRTWRQSQIPSFAELVQGFHRMVK